MAKLPSMEWLGAAAISAAIIATPALAAEVCVENATVGDLQEAVRTGLTTTAQLVRAYTARVEAYDRAGPDLNAVRELNPDAPAIAAALDALLLRDAAASRTPTNARRPLEGISVLLK